MAARTAILRCRVESDLRERFALAAQLDGLTASAAMRRLMSIYAENVAAAAHNSDAGPLVEDRRQTPSPLDRPAPATTAEEAAVHG